MSGTIDFVKSTQRYFDILPRQLQAWRALSLASRFILTAAVVIICGMTLVGAWVSDRIAKTVLQNSAARAGTYVVGLIGPSVQELETTGTISETARQRLNVIIAGPSFHNRVASVKIWRPKGLLVFATEPALIGKTFPEGDALRSAWKGNIEGEFDDLTADENNFERAMNRSLFEIYVPIRSEATGAIIAVAEVYEYADELAAELRHGRFEAAIIVGSLAIVKIAALYWIVLGGSRTIALQRLALADQVVRLQGLLDANTGLKQRIAEANASAVDVNDRFMRRIGADLHDGPAQLISFALLRLDAAIATRPSATGPSEGEQIREALRDALREIRGMSADLALPELGQSNVLTVIQTIAKAHQRRTGHPVAVSIGPIPATDTPLALKTSIYRFVQEGLNNASRHADGRGVRVSLYADDEALAVRVSDDGPGFDQIAIDAEAESKLGLRGMRDRIVAIGGNLDIQSKSGQGTQLTAKFPFPREGDANA